MKLQEKHDVEYVLNARKRGKRWLRVTVGLGAIVAGVTAYALVLPGISMTRTEQTLECPLEVHQHTEECYGDNGQIICGQAAYVVHKHDELCYDADGNLVCTLPEIEEHTHDDSCLTQQIVSTGEVGEDGAEETRLESVVTCGKDEVQLHTHSDACYTVNENGEKELTCDLLEVKEHQHGDGCFVTVSKDEKTDEKTDETIADKSGGAKSEEKKTEESLSAEETKGEDEALTGENTDGSEEVSGEEGKVEDGSEDEYGELADKSGETEDASGEVTDETTVEDGADTEEALDGSEEDSEIVGEDSELAAETDESGEDSELAGETDESGEDSELAGEADESEDASDKKDKSDKKDASVSADETDTSDEIVSESLVRRASVKARSSAAISDPDLPNCQEIIDIKLGEMVTTPTILKGYTVYYRFVASAKHKVIFESLDTTNDTYGYLYNSTGTLLTYDDDGGSLSRQFKVTYSNLTPGAVYYWGARFYSNTTTGAFPVKLYMDSDHNYVDGVCTICGNSQNCIGAAGNEENVTWTLDDDGTLHIQGTGAMDDFNAFSVPWKSSQNKITSVVIGDGVTSVGDSVFKGCKNLQSVTIQSSTLESVAEDAFEGCTSLEEIVMAPSADTKMVLSGDVLNTLMTWRDILSYQKPLEFELTGTATCGNVTLPAGNYYITAQGAIYQLQENGKASLVYCSLDLDDSGWSALPQKITTLEGDAYTLTSIGPYAFEGNQNLTSITVPATITSMGSGAFYNCSNLASVNGADTLADAYEALEGIAFSVTTFQGTSLYDNQEGVYNYTDGAVSVSKDEADNTYRLQLSSTLGENAEWVDGTTDTLLTGKTSVLKINLDQTGQGVTDTLRVYFSIDTGSDIYDAADNTLFNTEIGVAQTYTRNDGGSVDGTFYRVDDNLFYLELSDIDPGDTLTLYLSAMFPNFSAGGSLQCWVDNSEGASQPTDVKQLNWITRNDTFSLTESAYSTSSLLAPGTEDGNVWLRYLSYAVIPDGTHNYDAYGKNPMDYEEYTSTLQFPEDLPDGFAWREGVLDAIRAGNWYVSTTSSQKQIYVTIEEDGEEKNVLLAYISLDTKEYLNCVQHISVMVDENGNVQVYWQFVNTDTQKEIYNPKMYLYYGSEVIYANVDYLGEKLEEQVQASGSNATLSYTFTNLVDQEQHFRFDNATDTLSVSATSTGQVRQAAFSMSKSGSNSAKMGGDVSYKVSLTNSTIFPYTELKRLVDPLPDHLYLTPANMQTMFSDDTYGRLFSVAVTNAQICEMSSKTVTSTSDGTGTVDRVLQGTDTHYNGMSLTDTCKDRTVDMTLAWEDDHLKLTVKEQDEAKTTTDYTIGTGDGCDYSSIQAAMDDLGILVEKTTRYTCCWDLDDLTLWGGQTQTITISCTAKSTFQYLESDTRYNVYGSTSSNYEYAYNTAYVTYGDSGTETRSDNQRTRFNREYVLSKSVTKNNAAVTSQTELIAGDILTYSNSVSRTESGPFTYMPIVDKMSGGQVLLLKKSDNTSLSGTDWDGRDIDISSLPTKTVGEVEYYVLSTPGTYKHAKVGNNLADTVTVTATESSGLETLIYWYLNIGNFDWTFTYNVVIDPSVTQLDTSSGVKYYLKNEVWLGDHESHRLYDNTYFWGVVMSTDKSIVTNCDEIEDGHDPSTDELAEDSFIHQGETALYRIAISSVGDDFTLTVPGSAMTDTLPGSVSNGWTKDNVSIAYVSGADSTVTVSDPSADGWTIVDDTSTDDKTTQKIRWNSDFNIQVNGTVYIYVSLTFPYGEDGDDWNEYVHNYGSDVLYNTWNLYSLTDSVSHTLYVQAKARIQKGVYSTGTSVDGTYYQDTGATSRLYYANDTKSKGVVTYYTTIYNSGDTRLYISKVQDILPKGFTIRNLYGSTTSTGNYYTDIEAQNGSQDASATPIMGNFSYLKYTISDSDNPYSAGRQLLTFTISNTGSSALSYDSTVGKYYLKPGAYFTIMYDCYTNDYDYSEDAATNQVAMAYYDYNGAGVQLENDTTFTPGVNTSIIANDGDAMLVGTSQAYSMGFDTNGTLTKDTTGKDESAQWLVSQVTMNRGNIMPGIKKTATKTQVHTNDTITWNVTCTNGGVDAMRHYVISDVMMAPYTFTDSVSYEIYINGAEDPIASATLFKISDLPGVGEGAKEFTNAIFGKISARLDEDSTGKQVLTVEFLDKGNAAIPAGGGSGVLTVATKNLTTKRESKPYINQAYLTPVDQAFGKSSVHQGKFTTYKYFGEEEDGAAMNSVSTSAQVLASYGYATNAVKSVIELERNEDGDLVEMDNDAVSNTSTNSIVLSKGEDSIFRYNLTMENTGSSLVSADYMSLYVLVNNLPEVGDHNTFYTQYSRDSEFQVDFYAEDLDPEVTLTLKDGTIITLDSDQYELMFSTQTNLDYGEGDNANIWNGEELTSADGWYTLEECQEAGTLSSMRTMRVVIKDPDCAEKLMPGEVTIDVAYNAVVHQADDADATEDDDEENLATYSEIAWNSFGYLYEVDGDRLQSAPEKVGVQIPGVPFLKKQLTDNDGKTAFTAKRDETFTFLLYEGLSQSLDSTASLADLMLELHNKDIPFTVVTRSVAEGEDASESLPLDNMKLYTYDSNTKTCIEGEETWYWEAGENYTLMELEPTTNSAGSISSSSGSSSSGSGSSGSGSSQDEAYSDFSFYSLGGVKTNGLTFQYTTASSPEYVAINHRETWTLQIDKKDRATDAYLSGAYFGLYSPNQEDAMTTQSLQSLNLTITPDLTKEIDGQTWYLTKVDKTNSNGILSWDGLAEDSYYLVELKAPNNYGFIGSGETQVTRMDNQTVTSVTVLNDKIYALPNSGGVGRTLFYLLDAVVVLIALALLGWKYRTARKS